MSLPQPVVPAGCHLISLDSVGSTNEEAKAAASSGAAAGTVIWAGQQHTGKGRHGRVWESPPGNLYLSILQRPNCTPADAPQMGFVTGVALMEALGALSEVPAALKWPNDLLVNGKKASGILLESAASPDGQVAWLVIGVGVNLANSPSELPSVTSLKAEGEAISVERLLSAFLERLFGYTALWEKDGFPAIRDAWMSHAMTVGSNMRVRLPGGDVIGRFAGIDERGSLLLETENGQQRIDMGEVFPLPPVNEEVG